MLRFPPTELATSADVIGERGRLAHKSWRCCQKLNTEQGDVVRCRQRPIINEESASLIGAARALALRSHPQSLLVVFRSAAFDISVPTRVSVRRRNLHIFAAETACVVMASTALVSPVIIRIPRRKLYDSLFVGGTLWNAILSTSTHAISLN